MIHPSYTELLDVISKQEGMDISMLSRYTIIIAASKRARELTDGSEPLVGGVKTDKPVSIAVNELYQGKIEIICHNPDDDLIMESSDNTIGTVSEISLDNYGSEE